MVKFIKSHVNIGLSVEELNREEMELFDGKGLYMRHIKIYSLEDIDEKKIVK